MAAPKTTSFTPVTMGDLRKRNQALEIGCQNCYRHVYADPATIKLSDDVPVPEAAKYLTCSKCGFKNNPQATASQFIWARPDARPVAMGGRYWRWGWMKVNATDVTINPRAAIFCHVSSSPSSTLDESTPTTGMSRVPMAAVDAGRREIRMTQAA